MYIAITLTNFVSQVTSGLLTLDNVTNIKALGRNYSQRNTEPNYETLPILKTPSL